MNNELEEINESFWNRFDSKLLKRFQEARKEKKVARNFRIGEDLDEDFAKKCKNQGINKTDVVTASIVEFTYKNTLTAKGAIKIISRKEDSVITKMAKMALENEEDFADFIQYIKDQATDGNEESMKANHGADVINAIINHKL